MTYKGTVKGNTIEFEQPLSSLEGKIVTVNIEAIEDLPLGSPSRLLKAVHEPPHVDPSIVDELERAIEEAKMPVRYEGIFDSEAEQ